MQSFEYANPTTLKEATALLGSTWADAAVLAGGTDLISLMKDYVETPKRVVNIKGIKELGGIAKKGGGLRIGATGHVRRTGQQRRRPDRVPVLIHAAVRGVSSPQIRNMGTVGGDLCQRPRCWYYRTGQRPARHEGRQEPGPGRATTTTTPSSAAARRTSSVASSLGPALIALGAKVKLASASGSREVPRREVLRRPDERNDARDRAAAERDPDRDPHPGCGHEERHLRDSGAGSARLAARDCFCGAEDEGQRRRIGADRARPCRAEALGSRRSGAIRWPARPSRQTTAEQAGAGRRDGREAAQRQRLQGAAGEGRGEARPAGGRGKRRSNHGTRQDSTRSTMIVARIFAGRACSFPRNGTRTVQHCNDRAFWCQKTQIPLGPDGQIVDEYECHEGRNCFREL